MDPKTYLQKALRTETTPAFVNDHEGKPSMLMSRVMHSAMGMVTEAAEVVDMLKKHFIYGKPFDLVNFIEELGDGQWYHALGLAAVGYTFEDVFDRNIAKLLKRFPLEFTQDAALNRDLDAERYALEGGDLLGAVHALEQLLNLETLDADQWVTFRTTMGQTLVNFLRKKTAPTTAG